ncbi:hypothetical protein ACJX0J_039695, partial [Zea mays]
RLGSNIIAEIENNKISVKFCIDIVDLICEVNEKRFLITLFYIICTDDFVNISVNWWHAYRKLLLFYNPEYGKLKKNFFKYYIFDLGHLYRLKIFKIYFKLFCKHIYTDDLKIWARAVICTWDNLRNLLLPRLIEYAKNE